MIARSIYAAALAAFLALVLAGCAPMVAKPMSNQYGVAEAAFKGYGPATITGQAFVRQQGGGVVTCSGLPVLIVPATPYYREMFDMAKRRESPIGAQASVADTGIKTTCDAQGNFTFDRIKAGQWIVSVQITYSTGVLGALPEGGLLLKEATASEAPARILLTNADLFSK